MKHTSEYTSKFDSIYNLNVDHILKFQVLENNILAIIQKAKFFKKLTKQFKFTSKKVFKNCLKFVQQYPQRIKCSTRKVSMKNNE